MNVISNILDFFYPNICLLCKTAITDSNSLCVDCYKDMAFINENYCPTCGIVYEYSTLLKQLTPCENCLTNEEQFSIFSVCWYEKKARDSVVSYKSGNNKQMNNFYSKQYARVMQQNNFDYTVIVPVPRSLTSWALNGFNPIVYWGLGLAKFTKKPLKAEWLKRKSNNPQQSQITHNAESSRFLESRYSNVENAYSLNTSLFERELRNHTSLHVMLIDDVLTTGATLQTIYRLFQPYPVTVSAFTFARVRKFSDYYGHRKRYNAQLTTCS